MLHFSSLLAPTDVSECEIRNQGVRKDYNSNLHTSLDLMIFNGRAKSKLAMLAFLYCGDFVKNSDGSSKNLASLFRSRLHFRYILG